MKSEDNNTAVKKADPASKESGFFSSLYSFFNSIKLTVFLFIILGLVSIIGTIIEQGADPAKYAKEYSESTIQVFNALGLFDMYHTPWFFTLLLFLVLNLTICTIERLPRVLRFARNIKPELEVGDEKKYPFFCTIKISSNPEQKVKGVLKRYARIPWWVILVDIVSVAIAVILIRIYSMNVLEFTAFIVIPLIYIVLLNFPGKVARTEHDNTVHLFLNQWLISRFGVYVTHTSILIIFMGAIIGTLFGFKGYMAISEGETLNQMFIRQNKMIDTVSASVQSMFGQGKEDAQDSHDQNKFKTLPFSIRCDDFSISYYTNTGRPKDYTSDLVVLKNGMEVERKTIEVNDPLIVDKIYFYQSNYGQTGRPGLIVLKVAAPGTPAREYRTPVQGSFRLEGTQTDIQVQSFIPDFTIMDGHVRQRSNEMINPAVYLSAKEGQKILFNGWIFPNYPDYSLKTGNYEIEFIDYWGWQYTGLQVAYDPGVEVVWIGCSLLVVGLMISFFHSHQRVWARVSGNEVVLAGSSHKNRMGFEKKFNQLSEHLKE